MPLLMHKQARDTPRSGVPVLVCAPHRKVGVPIVQSDGDVRECVGEVPADDAALHEGEIAYPSGTPGNKDFRKLTFSLPFLVIDSMGNHWPV